MMTAEQLKNSILQLALQGNLISQSSKDQPAIVLLNLDQQKKKKNGRRRDVKQKDVGRIYKDENGEYIELKEGRKISVQNRIPFDIPKSWEWIHLGYVCDIARGGSPRPIKSYLTEEPDGINWIKIGDSDIGGKYINSTKEKINPEGMKKSRYVHSGDFLLTNSMSFGRPYILNCDGCIHDGWLVLTGYKDVYDKYFLYYMLVSGFAFNQFCDVVSGAVVKNLNSDKVADAVFPVPPLAEQKRIVAKIEELMPFVEQYAAASTKLNTLNATFPEMMKKSILQEAVQGKLVPQDPNDEPANVLLKKIAEEKKRLIKEGKIKKQKPLPEITEDEIPFDIPDSWEWVRLNDCMDVRDGTHDSPKYHSEGYPLVTSKNLRDGKIDFSTCKLISREDFEAINQRSGVGSEDILFAMIGTVGNPVLFHGKADFSIKNMALFKHIGDFLNMEYVYWFLLFAQNDMKKQATGGVQSFVSLNYLRNYLIPIPPVNEQGKIVEAIERIIPELNNI